LFEGPQLAFDSCQQGDQLMSFENIANQNLRNNFIPFEENFGLLLSFEKKTAQ
jgi:hypothetical protein